MVNVRITVRLIADAIRVSDGFPQGPETGLRGLVVDGSGDEEETGTKS